MSEPTESLGLTRQAFAEVMGNAGWLVCCVVRWAWRAIGAAAR